MNLVGGSVGFPQGVVGPAVTTVLFFLQLLRPTQINGSICFSQTPSAEIQCLCASDLVSCAAQGLEQVPQAIPLFAVILDLSHNRIDQLKGGAFEGLFRLETLRLAHNQLTTIQPGAFQNTSGELVRHLDLSFNRLRVVETHYFQELPGLEELLLFNNRIVQVESRALSGLGNLQKAYLSHNRLTHFPFFSIQEHSHPYLITMDLSSNRLLKLPLEDILNLPLQLQKGLYLHNNSLECECSMYGLFRHWEQRGYASVKHFRQEHTCRVYGMEKRTVRFFQNHSYFDKCNMTTVGSAINGETHSISVKVGGGALLHCMTSLVGTSVTFLWVSPNREYVAPPGNNGSLKMFTNGSLEIIKAHAKDSGIYWCMALDQRHQRNDTCEVNVTVELHHHGQSHGSFNTGFTTLLGCVVSLVLVLMYLYLTPCHCPPFSRESSVPDGSKGNEGGAGSAKSSILIPTPPATTEGPGRKVSTNKHVVFLEPIREQKNGGLREGPCSGVNQGHVVLGSVLESKQHLKIHIRKAGDTESMVSVFSDTPIMLRSKTDRF